MRILLVSIKSIHFRRWAAQLEHSGHEVFYFDISGKVGFLSGMPWLKQKKSWKYRWNFPGRYVLKKSLPRVSRLLKCFNERPVDKIFEAYLNEVQPDVVQSFALHLSCVPILNVMKAYPSIKWIFSAWGSDLYYHQNLPVYKKGIIDVLPRVDYLFTDCQRDAILAKQLGFNGKVLGVFPGGGGYDFKVCDPYILEVEQRHTIVIKGYEKELGRCINVLKALLLLKDELKGFELVVFGADPEVVDFVELNQFASCFNFRIHDKINLLSHQDVLKLMGQSIIYIGNSNSDGMPNTLLEAIIMGAFPIQSNPGGASAEIINHGENGLLIEDCNDVKAIKKLIQNAMSDNKLLEDAFYINQTNIKPQLEISTIREKVLAAYNRIIVEKT